jgi:uncharacterized membrane protein YhhN
MITAVAALYVYYSLKKKHLYVFFKTLTTLLITLFCGASYVLYRHTDNSLFITLIITGLIFSIAGDLIICIRKNIFFLTALLCFICTHVIYTVCFFLYAPFLPVDVITGIIFSLSGILIYRYFRPHLKKLKIPVAVYIIFITCMLWRASVTVYSTRLSLIQGIFIAAGSVLFYLSDIVLGINMFIKPIKKFVLINLTLYYMGQLFIVLSCYYFF